MCSARSATLDPIPNSKIIVTKCKLPVCALDISNTTIKKHLHKLFFFCFAPDFKCHNYNLMRATNLAINFCTTIFILSLFFIKFQERKKRERKSENLPKTVKTLLGKKPRPKIDVKNDAFCMKHKRMRSVMELCESVCTVFWLSN